MKILVAKSEYPVVIGFEYYIDPSLYLYRRESALWLGNKRRFDRENTYE